MSTLNVTESEFCDALILVLLSEIKKPQIKELASLLGLKLRWFQPEKTPIYKLIKNEWLFLLIFVATKIGLPSAHKHRWKDLEKIVLGNCAARVSMPISSFIDFYLEKTDSYRDVLLNNDFDEFMYPKLAGTFESAVGNPVNSSSFAGMQIGLKLMNVTSAQIRFMRGFVIVE